jgi:type II secretory pathway component PulJ
MLVAVAIFTVITAGVFTLLDQSQQRYRSESEFLDAFQGGRIAVDQMTRDIHMAGYPPRNAFESFVVAANPAVVAMPFAWSPNYPITPCTVGVTCNASGGPAAFDLMIETDINPEDADGIEWIRYRLNGTTLERGVATKAVGTDPATATQAAMVPYVENVMNNTTVAQMNRIQANYPGMFPGNAPVPVFTYGFDAGGGNIPASIREVNINLIVMAPNPDPRSQALRVTTLTGRARRINPNR